MKNKNSNIISEWAAKHVAAVIIDGRYKAYKNARLDILIRPKPNSPQFAEIVNCETDYEIILFCNTIENAAEVFVNMVSKGKQP